MSSTMSLANYITLPYQMGGLENSLGSRSKPHRTLIFLGVIFTHVSITSLLGSRILANMASLYGFLVILRFLSSQILVENRGWTDPPCFLSGRAHRSAAYL